MQRSSGESGTACLRGTNAWIRSTRCDESSRTFRMLTLAIGSKVKSDRVRRLPAWQEIT